MITPSPNQPKTPPSDQTTVYATQEKGSRPVFSAIVGALSGAAAAALISWFSDSSLERQKFDYSMIQGALRGTTEEKVERLRFLLDMGLISDDELRKNLQTRLDDPDGANLPELSSPSPSIDPPTPVSVLPDLGDLAGYKVKIFYSADKPEDKEAATELFELLKSEVSDVTFEIGEARDTASSDQIRYEPGSEDAAAAALKQLLDDIYPDRRFRTQTVKTKLPNYMSIFFKTK